MVCNVQKFEESGGMAMWGCLNMLNYKRLWIFNTFLYAKLSGIDQDMHIAQ